MRSTNGKLQSGESDANKNTNIFYRTSPNRETKFDEDETFFISDEDSPMKGDLNNFDEILCDDMTNDEIADLSNLSLNFFCKSCEYVTTDEVYFRQHQKIHSNGDGFYCCHLCDFKSKSQTWLSSHMIRSHPEFRPFYCPICDYKGKSKGNLQSHMITHSSNRPYECPHCSFTARREDYLTAHLKRHHGQITSSKPKLKNKLNSKQISSPQIL